MKTLPGASSPIHLDEPTIDCIGNYRVLARLAEGGMAEIFLAQREGIPGVEKRIVLKRVLPHLLRDATFVKQFLAEARLASTLEHPNIVQVFEVGEASGSYFMAMEFLEGANLNSLGDTLRSARRKLPLDVAITVVLGVLRGLHYLHEKRGSDGEPLGLVHRDIKPHNVIVTFEGGVKILDFGIAKSYKAVAQTRAGIIKGTVPYMSPEQCRGRMLDRRSDVFSAGILLYELTTGEELFTSEDSGQNEIAIAMKIVDGPPPEPEKVDAKYPRALAAIVRRALDRKPLERFQTAEEFRAALEAFARESGIFPSEAAVARFMSASLPGRVEAVSERGGTVTLGASAGGAIAHAYQSEERDHDSGNLDEPPRRRWIAGSALAAVLVLAAVAGVRSRDRAEPSAHTSAPSPSLSPSPSPSLSPSPSPSPSPLPSTVALSSPERTHRTHTQAPARAPATLLLESTPWCDVYVDGINRGPTPLTIDVAPGKHRLRLHNAEFHVDERVIVSVRAGERFKKRFAFTR